MTVTLTQDTANARVRIDADDLRQAVAVMVERSTNQIAWTTIRGGVSIPTNPGGAVLPGTSGNYVSTPDNAALDIAGDIDLRADVTLADWTPVGRGVFLSKWVESGDQRSYKFQLEPSGLLTFEWSSAGTAASAAFLQSTASAPFSSGRGAVRVAFDADNGASGRTATFYTASTIDGPWTQLGSPVTTGTVTSIHSGTATLEIGSKNGGTVELLAGTVHAVEVRNGINGTVVANPFFVARGATGGFTDPAGRVWTYNGTASWIHTTMVTTYDYEFVPGVANYYRVTAVLAGLYRPSTSNSSPITPDNAALDITGDIDLRVDFFTPSNGGSIGGSDLLSKLVVAGNQRSYQLWLDASNIPHLDWSNNGTAVLGAAATAAITVGNRIAVRGTLDVDNGAAGRTITFYTAATINGPWTQLGAAVVQGGTTSIFNSTAPLEIGSEENGAAFTFGGEIYAAEVRNGINGTVVANPRFDEQTHVDNSFVDGAGRTWTMNGWGNILTTQAANIVPVLDRIWLKSLTRPFLNRPATVVGFTDPTRPARSTERDVVNRTNPVATNDIRSSRRWTIDVHTRTRADAQTLEYLLASGDVVFVHVPRNCDVTGGYVQVKNYGQRHPEGRVRGEPRIWSLPLVEVAPPGPDVVAAIGTWTTVLAAYATWDDVLAAFPTWDDLLQLHGDPAEVIVP